MCDDDAHQRTLCIIYYISRQEDRARAMTRELSHRTSAYRGRVFEHTLLVGRGGGVYMRSAGRVLLIDIYIYLGRYIMHYVNSA